MGTIEQVEMRKERRMQTNGNRNMHKGLGCHLPEESKDVLEATATGVGDTVLVHTRAYANTKTGKYLRQRDI